MLIKHDHHSRHLSSFLCLISSTGLWLHQQPECRICQTTQHEGQSSEIRPMCSSLCPFESISGVYEVKLQRANTLQKSLMLGKIEGRRRRRGWGWATEDETVGWHHPLDGMSLSKLWEIVEDRESWHAVVNGIIKSQTRLSY